MPWETVIGLEVHAQLATRTKLFCGCELAFGEPPNTRVCPVCLGMPGVLPVLNEAAVAMAVRTALALNCEIQSDSTFARKNYFYPDLPKGYQISQYDRPFALGGRVPLAGSDGDGGRDIRLVRIHMEEDAGKLVHAAEAFEEATHSFVDLNRAGTPLIEIVSEPDLRSPEEAGEYLRTLRNTLLYLGVCNADMEKGEFRCDANVSIRESGATELGTKVELKNMNSFRFVERALAYEVERQQAALEAGEDILQETRLWNEAKGATLSMRSKEEAHDYRYFPDPDLIPLRLDSDWVADLRGRVPELGHQKSARYQRELGLPAYDAGVLTAEPATAQFFEAVVAAGADPKAASNWIMGELSAALNREAVTIADLRFSPADLAALLALIADGTISGKSAKDVFSQMFEKGGSPAAIVAAQGLEQISDAAAIVSVVDEVLQAHPEEVAQYRAGKQKLRGFFVGKVMKATGGKANPKIVNEVLSERLDAERDEEGKESR